MSPMFSFIKSMYDRERYTKEKVKSYAPVMITPEEYREITGEEYAE